VPYEDLSDIIGPNPMVFGTTKDERIFSFEEVDALFKSQFEQMGNMEPAFERKRIARRISKDGNSAFIAEEITLTLSSPEVVNTIFMRATCVMEYLDGRWKLIHWHTSTPVDTENDHWHLEEWKREKEKLQKLVDQQTADLQRKNRELQIEAALERVRARTMAMQHSNELAQLVGLVFNELVALDFSLTRCYIYIIDPESLSLEAWTFNTEIGGIPSSFRIQHLDLPYYKAMIRAWKTQKKKLVYELSGEDKKETDRVLFGETAYKNLPEAVKAGMTSVEQVYLSFSFNHFGAIQTGGLEPLSDEKLEIFDRFGNVFDLTYTRFNDLQNAEAQHRESKIELALERVRARTMAMQKSDELADVAFVLFEQLRGLGGNLWGTGFGLCKENANKDEFWFANEGGLLPPVTIPNKDDPAHKRMYESWRAKIDFLAIEGSGKELAKHYEYMMSLPEVRPFFQEILDKGLSLPEWQQWNAAYFSHGYLLIITLEPYPEPFILKRFARVFDQTYTRFLDLKKAEAQAREAKIEAALERLRSRSMAMHKSEELSELSLELVKQVQELGVATWFCAFNIYEDENGSLEWGSNGKGTFSKYRTPREGIFLDYYNAGQRGEKLLINEIGEHECPAHYEYLCSLPGVGDQLLKMKEAGIPFPNSQIDHVAFFKYGYIIFITYDSVPESHDIFKRFAKVFEQTYTRFLDLQKAEAQTREAKIEAALEKVRSRTMGMQSSDELPEVANLMFNEVRALGIHAWSCGYNILAEDKKTATGWMSSEGTLQKPFTLRLWGEASFEEMGDFLRSEKTMLVQELGDKAIEEHYAHMKSFPDLKPTFDQIDTLGLSLPTYQINHLCKFTQGFLLFITYEKVPEVHDIFMRFTKVFEQTYTRFVDLQKAEAQTREAKVEAVLEKVRSRSLAMQSPDELIEVAQLLREEMGVLGVEELETSSIYIHDEHSGLTQCWFTIKDKNDPGKTVADQMMINLKDTWVGRKMERFYHSNSEKTSILMQGKNRIEWIRYCEGKTKMFGSSNFYGDAIPERTYHLYKFSNGYIGAAAPGEISKESWDLIRRATAAFSFAYTRFQDLQKAEASARAALQQASLDRVRAEVSSMRNAKDLERITPLIFNELTTLGIPFIRCGVFIVHEKSEKVEVYLSTPEGQSLAAMKLPFNANELAKRSVEAWKKEEVYVQYWSKADFIDYGKLMVSQGQVKDLKTYQGDVAPPEALHLHFVPFDQGLLYVGSTERLDAEQIDLVKALARVFSIAYARYEDFVKMEQAKAEVELAMSELKATQSQLIQSEKMASLGELTAGIAHEIQNPLNFVNNFSEVSEELLIELKEELEKGDMAEASLISEDVIQNLQKIHHHGQRASSIVKGMLEHSRTGTRKKELTDINALADEYLRLSYHGLRAKDKSFNAEFIIELDQTLPKIKIIGQDIGRVLLNLINNAFYAVSEKAKKGIEKGYKPKVTVKTKRKGRQIEIRVKDNADGIPPHIINKIFQPFFTTKPTGSGTGLGLSLSYDIVTKGHNGSLEVDTTEGVGSEFIIQLPAV
jgi:signal transduction histidine kinase